MSFKKVDARLGPKFAGELSVARNLAPSLGANDEVFFGRRTIIGIAIEGDDFLMPIRARAGTIAMLFSPTFN